MKRRSVPQPSWRALDCPGRDGLAAWVLLRDCGRKRKPPAQSWPVQCPQASAATASSSRAGSPSASTWPSLRSMQRIAVPVADSAARTFDHRHQRCPVVQLEIGLADDIDMARGEQGVIVAIAAHDHPLVIGACGKRHEMAALVVVEIMRPGGGESRFGQAGAGAGAAGLAVERGRPARSRRPSAPSESAGRSRPAPASLRSPARSACRKSAVRRGTRWCRQSDRAPSCAPNCPGPAPNSSPITASRGTSALRMRRIASSAARSASGNRRGIALAFADQPGAEIGADRVGGGIGEALGKGEIGFEVHQGPFARSGAAAASAARVAKLQVFG